MIGMATAEEVAQNIEWLAESHAVPASIWVEAKSEGMLSHDVATLV